MIPETRVMTKSQKENNTSFNAHFKYSQSKIMKLNKIRLLKSIVMLKRESRSSLHTVGSQALFWCFVLNILRLVCLDFLLLCVNFFCQNQGFCFYKIVLIKKECTVLKWRYLSLSLHWHATFTYLRNVAADVANIAKLKICNQNYHNYQNVFFIQSK